MKATLVGLALLTGALSIAQDSNDLKNRNFAEELHHGKAVTGTKLFEVDDKSKNGGDDIVPEPATLLVMGAGALVLFAKNRKKRS